MTQPGATYFVTSQTWQRRALFRNPQWAELFRNTLQSYRGRARLLHEFVLMPEHFHILITPAVTLERAVQFIKGGFTFRANKELDASMAIRQVGFSDHHIRDASDYNNHLGYVYRNPIGRKLVELASDCPYRSAHPGAINDGPPQWLKPHSVHSNIDAAEAASRQQPDMELVTKS
jgi:putative transposase